MGWGRKPRRTRAATHALGGGVVLTIRAGGRGGSAGTVPGSFDGYAELPRETPSYSYSPPTGGITHTPTTPAELNTLLTGGTLGGQTLQRGDVIQLTAGTQYTDGTYTQQTFPRTDTMTSRGGASSLWVYVVSSALGSLPVAGRRVGTGDKATMPLFRQITSGGAPAILFADYADRYAFVGIAADGGSVTSTSRIWEIGNGTATTIAAYPTNITLDRCYVAAESASNNCTRPVYVRRAGANIVVTGCYIYCEAAASLEQQALLIGRKCTGPILIDNSALWAATENLLSGGDDEATEIVADVTIRRCYLTRDPDWQSSPNPGSKNFFELKAGRRVLFEDNFCDVFWANGQTHAINLKSVNQTGTDDNVQTSDVVLRYNRWRDVVGWLKVSPGQNEFGGTFVDTSRITARHNVVEGFQEYGADSAVFVQGVNDVTVSHNTVVSDAGATGVMWYPGTVDDNATGLVAKDNIFERADYGVKAAATAEGTASLDATYSGYVFTSNVLIGATGGSYPGGNFVPANVAAVGFENAGTRDYRLAAGSDYKNAASDSGDIGADVVTVLSRTTGCATGTW